MAREEAIKALEILKLNDIEAEFESGDRLCFFYSRKALEMAINALEQEPCDDAINRQIISDYVGSHIQEINTGYGDLNKHTNEILRMIVDYIESMPPATPQSKTGHWSRKTKVDAYDIEGVKTWGIKCQCDRCYFTTIVVEDFGYYKYCPNCGAKMESEDKE